jgi:hypothetical protein
MFGASARDQFPAGGVAGAVAGAASSARGGVSGALAGAGGSKSVPSGATGTSTGRALPPNWSITELPVDFSAAIRVKLMEVMINPTAKIHVTLVSAVAAARPAMAPLPPPPMPKPPPSERCINTTPIRHSARIRWMVRTTFSIGLLASAWVTRLLRHNWGRGQAPPKQAILAGRGFLCGSSILPSVVVSVPSDRALSRAGATATVCKLRALGIALGLLSQGARQACANRLIAAKATWPQANLGTPYGATLRWSSRHAPHLV